MIAMERSGTSFIYVCVMEEGQERKGRKKESAETRETGRGVVAHWMRHAHQKLSMNICKYDGCVWV